MKRLSFIFFISFAITACGFHLRGTVPISDSIHRLAIEPHTPDLPLHREIRTLLRSSGVLIVSPSQKPDAILYIISDEFIVEDTSIGADGRIREKSYTYASTFELKTPQGQTLLPVQRVQSQRLIEFDPDLALAQTMQAQIVKEENRRDVANQLVRRLAYAPTVPSATEEKAPEKTEFTE